jgi:hypothetical protein
VKRWSANTAVKFQSELYEKIIRRVQNIQIDPVSHMGETNGKTVNWLTEK